MKHNKNHDNAKSADTQLVPVHFEFTSPTATSVCIAGTFNRWQPESKTLPNPFGGRNSILTVANSPEAAHLADAENLPLKSGM